MSTWPFSRNGLELGLPQQRQVTLVEAMPRRCENGKVLFAEEAFQATHPFRKLEGNRIFVSPGGVLAWVTLFRMICVPPSVLQNGHCRMALQPYREGVVGQVGYDRECQRRLSRAIEKRVELPGVGYGVVVAPPKRGRRTGVGPAIEFVR